ncbi:MAG: RNA recognition motif domain-containing protein [Anaerolineae bacterium]|jgi:RNA recognition motif-containing protein
MAKKLYVGNLSYSTTEGALSDLFGELGEVASVNLITDRMSGRSKGFAFVEMAEESAAQQAIAELNGKELDGREIKVAEARPRRERRDSWGGGGGGGGGGGRRGRY